MNETNLTLSYRAMQIMQSSELLDTARNSDNWQAKALIMDRLVTLARHDKSLYAAMAELGTEAEQAEDAMIDHYTVTHDYSYDPAESIDLAA